MSFGLKNAGATYQRAIQLCFSDQLHRNVEAYVDDVVVKTKTQNQFKAAMQPVSFWTSLMVAGASMAMMALIFF